MVKIVGMFAITGLITWAIFGAIVGMSCFEPVVDIEVLKNNKELATEVSNNWSLIMKKTAGTWAVSGAIVGFVTFFLFYFRPSYEHRTVMPRHYSPGPFGDSAPGPKTLAETHAGFQSWVLGIIVAVILAVAVLPSFSMDLLVVKSLKMRVIICVIGSLISTVCILPFSLGWIKKTYDS